jgi:hypothetical protein
MNNNIAQRSKISREWRRQQNNSNSNNKKPFIRGLTFHEKHELHCFEIEKGEEEMYSNSPSERQDPLFLL